MNTPYFVRRRSAGRGKAQPPDQATTYTRFPEVQVVADRSTHLVLAALPGLGPAPDVQRFGQRWQVECVFSMVKRRLGPAVLGRSGRTRDAEMMLKLITHNLMILAAGAGRRLTAVLELIYRAGGVHLLETPVHPCREPRRISHEGSG